MLRFPVGVAVIVVGSVGVGVAQAQSPSAVDWSGFYVGGGVGGTVGVSETTTFVASGGSYLTGTDFSQVASSGRGDLSQWRASGGVEVGYSRQFGNILLGVEASANTLSLDELRSAGQTYLTAPPARYTLHQSVKADWQATVRPRLGWAQDNWLAYVTGGLAVTQVTLDTKYYDNFAAGGFGGAVGRSSDTETKAGWTLGLGGEYALNRNWSLRGDYLYADFGSVDSSTVVRHPGSGTSVLDSSADLRTHTVLIGLTYRFDGF